MGTSCAAPLWAGFCALINQQSVAASGTTVGFINPAIYTIANGSNYNACFHDVTVGNNIGTNTPGFYNAVTGYDLTTGLGTPTGTNLINALAPALTPFFESQPASVSATNNANVTFIASVAGQSPLNYQWLFNGSNLVGSGNISGSTSNILAINGVGTNNSGNYSLVVTNIYGAITSSVAVLNVGFVPTISSPPANLIVFSGNNAELSVVASGSTPLSYQWRYNGTNLLNGGNLSGATSDILKLTAVTTNQSGNYDLVVADAFGTVTSSATALTVVLPAAIGNSSLINQTVQCGSNNLNFAVAASGTAPLSIQWSVDGSPVYGATNNNFSLTNLYLPNHTISVQVTNLYNGLTSNTIVTVIDTLAPQVTLNGANPIYVELGSTFTDPSATAVDLCEGVVGVMASGSVNGNIVGTNILTYTANDGNGNVGTAQRTVIVHDTTPPTILWSFTNLVLAANANCSGLLPDVTGTNFILATDLSLPLSISQAPTNNTSLPLGTNEVILTVLDAYGNASYSTNLVFVLDQTPPVIASQPASQTNLIGTSAAFTVAATACSVISYQWYFANAPLPDQTNSGLTITNLTLSAAGNYFVVAAATGGTSTSSVVTLTVNLLSSSITVGSSKNPSGYLDQVVYTASMEPVDASGTVQFLTNGTMFDLETVVTGQAISQNVTDLPRGTNLITAIYSGDGTYLPATTTLVEIVTNHPPTAASALYTNIVGLPMVIAITNLAATWNDIDGDTVFLAAVSISTNGITVTNTGSTLVYFNSNNVADEFTCTISDGVGGTNYQTVFITSIVPTDPTPLITGLVAVNGGITLNLSGASGYTYALAISTNLAAGGWQFIATNALTTNGGWQFTDTQTTNFPQRFYRVYILQ
jgi:hypothetical protein